MRGAEWWGKGLTGERILELKKEHKAARRKELRAQRKLLDSRDPTISALNNWMRQFLSGKGR